MKRLSPIGLRPATNASRKKGATYEEYRDLENYAPKGSTYLSFAAPWSLYSAPDLGYAEYQATSSNAHDTRAGIKTFLIAPGKKFAAGRRVVVANAGQAEISMEGDVVSYDSISGALVLAIDTSSVDQVTFASDWVLYQKAQQGIDFLNTIRVNPSTYPDDTLITSSWPEDLGIGIGGALGFNIISQGNYNRGVPAVPTPSVRVNELSVASHTVRWTWVSGDPENANVLDEWYVTSVADNLDTKTAEIGFFLHAPTATIAFHSAGRQIGLYTDEHARGWKVAQQLTGDAGNFIMLIRTDHSDVTSSTLDLRRLMFWLVDKGEISGNSWLNGTAVGVEPLGGKTAVRFDTFEAVQSRIANGTPGAILRLSIAAQTSSSVTVAFEDLASNVTGHEYRLNGGGWTALPGDRTIAGLTAGTSVSIEVRGVNGSKKGSPSRAIEVSIGSTLNLIPAPADRNSTEWNALGMTDPVAGFADSVGDSSAARSLETAIFDNHFREYAVRGLPEAAGDYWFRARLKGAGRHWAYLHVFAGTFRGDHRQHFNLATGELGVAFGLGADLAFVEASSAAAGEGYHDVAIRVTKSEGVTVLYLRAGSADADGNIYFTGDPEKGLLFDGTSGSFRLEPV